MWYKDAIDIIKNAKSIKAAEIFISKDTVRQNKFEQMLNTPSIRSNMDELEGVTLMFKQ